MIRSWWWNGDGDVWPKTNFGDEIMPAILSKVTGQDVEKGRLQGTEDLLVAGGSIAQFFFDRPNVVLWGTGIFGDHGRHATPGWEVLAVRGPKTARALGLADATPFGDAGLLAPLLLDPAEIEAHDQVVVVPHFGHRAYLEGRPETDRFRVLDPTGDPLEVVRGIAGASQVVASSLHGLVVADAFGKPSAFLGIPGDPVMGGSFKFEDHDQAVDVARAVVPLHDLRDFQVGVRRGLEASAAPMVADLQEGLLDALDRFFR